MIRSSHGSVPRGRAKPEKAADASPRPASPRSAGASRAAAGERPARRGPPKATSGAATRRAKAILPKPAAPEREERDEAPRAKRGERGEDEGAKVKKAKVAGATSTASDDAREVAIAIATAALDKKASGLEVIDVAGRVDYADFLVLMSGRSDRHVAALAGGIEDALRKLSKRALAVEGLPHANWVLMDFGDVVVHVFQDDARATYDFDALWMDARRVPVPVDAVGPTSP
jgi:ribosome-associated protein